MLTRLLRSFRRADPATPAAASAADALLSLVRVPLPHPKRLDYEAVAVVLAAAGSAEYMVRHMQGARNLVGHEALLAHAIACCEVDGLMLEFGVYRGNSLRRIAGATEREVHGFDSFEGLPEDWTWFQKRGRFSLEGRAPTFTEPNVRIHQGWFDAVLPGFLADHPQPVRLLHIDCDLYSSTQTVLQLLSGRLVPGTVIVFDEYLNYPGWEQHEFRAFQEFVAAGSLRYEYIGFASSDYAVAVRIKV
ncbi:MAG: class I SAM-dependent methyltransferase [Burkholderiales bacterium]